MLLNSAGRAIRSAGGADLLPTSCKKFDSSRERCWIGRCGGMRLGCIFLVAAGSPGPRAALAGCGAGARGAVLVRELVPDSCSLRALPSIGVIVLWTGSTAGRRRGTLYSKPGSEYADGRTIVSARPFVETWELALVALSCARAALRVNRALRSRRRRRLDWLRVSRRSGSRHSLRCGRTFYGDPDRQIPSMWIPMNTCQARRRRFIERTRAGMHITTRPPQQRQRAQRWQHGVRIASPRTPVGIRAVRVHG